MGNYILTHNYELLCSLLDLIVDKNKPLYADFNSQSIYFDCFRFLYEAEDLKEDDELLAEFCQEHNCSISNYKNVRGKLRSAEIKSQASFNFNLSKIDELEILNTIFINNPKKIYIVNFSTANVIPINSFVQKKGTSYLIKKHIKYFNLVNLPILNTTVSSAVDPVGLMVADVDKKGNYYNCTLLNKYEVYDIASKSSSIFDVIETSRLRMGNNAVAEVCNYVFYKKLPICKVTDYVKLKHDELTNTEKVFSFCKKIDNWCKNLMEVGLYTSSFDAWAMAKHYALFPQTPYNEMIFITNNQPVTSKRYFNKSILFTEENVNKIIASYNDFTLNHQQELFCKCLDTAKNAEKFGTGHISVMDESGDVLVAIFDATIELTTKTASEELLNTLHKDIKIKQNYHLLKKHSDNNGGMVKLTNVDWGNPATWQVQDPTVSYFKMIHFEDSSTIEQLVKN